MKTVIRLLFIISPLFLNAQITTPIIKANFGVDADLRANYFNGFIQSGNDDWYNNGTAGTGRFVIDTTGAAAKVAGYLSDVSPWPRRMASFFGKMSVPQFSIINNRLWLDAIFVRDYHGNDTTVFASGSSKNGMSPANWNCPVSQSIPDKNDILDMFMHIRRAGPNTTDSLWMFGALSLDNTTGNRYFDFEMYQTDIYYDRGSRQWYGYGPDAGHTTWQFDAAGNVTKPGDIILTGEYQSSTLTNIEARIWINSSSLSMTPTQFNWSGQFDGAASGATFGYASILPKTAGAFYTGLGCANNTWTGPFQVVLQDNSVATTYTKDQFMEFSVNLTKLGLDPVSTFGGDICGTPFNRIVVKTRASSSFTAELKDFVAPTDLFLAPRVNALADVPLFCGTITVSNIVVQNPSASSVYTWTTSDGHIVGTTTGTSIMADAPGTYIVMQQLAAGCSAYAYDTVTVLYDPNCYTLERDILSFSGVIRNKMTTLDWSVGHNNEIAYFDIERSFDGIHFESINQVNADGSIELNANYSTTDDLSEISFRPAVYYRLKVKKLNGISGYSKIIRIPFGSFPKRIITVSPNPVNDVMQVTVNTNKKEEMQLYFYDMSGRAMRKTKISLVSGTNVISFDNFSEWDKGMYLVVARIGDETYRQKIVLAK
jgi:hypothetical protein